MTIMGTRPEIIRLSQVIKTLDAQTQCEHVLVWTGQNQAAELASGLFAELGVRKPNQSFRMDWAGFGFRLGQLASRIEAAILAYRPDRVLILGDTDSGLSALVAKRMGIRVYHMEAGNRCFDDRVPEEINRRVIDHCSDVLMPYTERARANLLREGIASDRIFVIGNPIWEVINTYGHQAEGCEPPFPPQGYFLATIQRTETVDNAATLRSVLAGLADVQEEWGMPIVFPIHPHTEQRISADESRRLMKNEGIYTKPPLGFFEFVNTERHAFCVLTDSGTVQEECCLLGTPCVTMRDVTERPETIEAGGNVLAGTEPAGICRAVLRAVNSRSIMPPPEYTRKHVAATVANIIMGR
jgi:UDP-N-acetylglucosamine 2-epimerase (non-hydrolysing)